VADFRADLGHGRMRDPDLSSIGVLGDHGVVRPAQPRGARRGKQVIVIGPSRTAANTMRDSLGPRSASLSMAADIIAASAGTSAAEPTKLGAEQPGSD
jgi:hypothetical protein